MSEQWHYEQKGESYIKVDTLHKIRTLESELAAARKEIAELKEEYGTWWAQKRIAIDELKEVTEQRDQYKAALQSADNHNHEIATKLEIVTEQRDTVTLRLGDTQVRMFDAERQRDRLAGGLKWIAGWNHQLFDKNTAMQMRDKAEQALQSLNPDHTVAANDMIAAVKGGSDES